jgi:hypothetical protein
LYVRFQGRKKLRIAEYWMSSEDAFDGLARELDKWIGIATGLKT